MLIKVFSVLSMLSRLPPWVHVRGGRGAIALAKQAVEFPQVLHG